MSIVDYILKGNFSDHLFIFNGSEIKVCLDFLKEKTSFFKKIYEKGSQNTEIYIKDLNNVDFSSEIFKKIIKSLYEDNFCVSFCSYLNCILIKKTLEEKINLYYLFVYLNLNELDCFSILLENLKKSLILESENFEKTRIYFIKNHISYKSFIFFTKEEKIYKYKFESILDVYNCYFSLYVFENNNWKFQKQEIKEISKIEIVKIYKENIKEKYYNFLKTIFDPKDIDFCKEMVESKETEENRKKLKKLLNKK